MILLMIRLAILAWLLTASAWAQSLEWGQTRLAIQLPRDGGNGAAEFHFKNSGDRPVFIKQAAASCNCVSTKFDHRMTDPGESGVVSLTVSPKGRPGTRAFRIYVTTDEKGVRPYELTLEVSEFEKIRRAD